MIIKCLSLKQPFADLIVSGKKTIELRKWNTKHRGVFLVHASKVPLREFYSEEQKRLNNLPLGCIVGQATLTHVKWYGSYTEWIEDKDKHLAGDSFIESNYGFVLKDASRLETPIPIAGMLNFFSVDIDLVNLTARHIT